MYRAPKNQNKQFYFISIFYYIYSYFRSTFTAQGCDITPFVSRFFDECFTAHCPTGPNSNDDIDPSYILAPRCLADEIMSDANFDTCGTEGYSSKFYQQFIRTIMISYYTDKAIDRF